MAQGSSIFAFGEMLHEHGIESHISTHSAGEHSDGKCFAGDLVVHLCIAISSQFYTPFIEQFSDLLIAINPEHLILGYLIAPAIRDPPTLNM